MINCSFWLHLNLTSRQKNQSPRSYDRGFSGAQGIGSDLDYTQVFTFGEDAVARRLQASLTRTRAAYALDSVALATEPSSNQRVAAPEKPKPPAKSRGFSGAATQIRTGDLILTKDVLYQLSHSSKSQECFLVTQIIIPKHCGFVNTFIKFCYEFF